MEKSIKILFCESEFLFFLDIGKQEMDFIFSFLFLIHTKTGFH